MNLSHFVDVVSYSKIGGYCIYILVCLIFLGMLQYDTLIRFGEFNQIQAIIMIALFEIGKTVSAYQLYHSGGLWKLIKNFFHIKSLLAISLISLSISISASNIKTKMISDDVILSSESALQSMEDEIRIAQDNLRLAQDAYQTAIVLNTRRETASYAISDKRLMDAKAILDELNHKKQKLLITSKKNPIRDSILIDFLAISIDLLILFFTLMLHANVDEKLKELKKKEEPETLEEPEILKPEEEPSESAFSDPGKFVTRIDKNNNREEKNIQFSGKNVSSPLIFADNWLRQNPEWSFRMLVKTNLSYQMKVEKVYLTNQ